MSTLRLILVGSLLLVEYVAAQGVNCGFTNHPKGIKMMEKLKRGSFGITSKHRGVNERFKIAYPPLHPNAETILLSGRVNNFPANHPDLDMICATMGTTGQIPLPPGHPDIDQALKSGIPIPNNHPPVHEKLKFAMTTTHPNADLLLKSSTLVLPANHPPLNPWYRQPPTPPPSPLPAGCLNPFPPADLARHNTQNDCYIAIDGKVYDFTSYLASHPGGVSTMLPSCGTEGSDAFRRTVQHSAKVPFSGRVGVCKGTYDLCSQPFPAAELARHNSPGDCYMAIRGKVYDFTNYLPQHPAGVSTMQGSCGSDATQAFETQAKHARVSPFQGGKGVCKGTYSTTMTLPPTTQTITSSCAQVPFPAAELARHATEQDCYILLEGFVFDFTSYLGAHPGGKTTMTPYCGRDGSVAYTATAAHTNRIPFAQKGTQGTCKGKLSGTTNGAATSQPTPIGSGSLCDRPMEGSELAKHSTANDCWVAINNRVYDMTTYLPFHPAGATTITPWCGREGTAAFNGQTGHSNFIPYQGGKPLCMGGRITGPIQISPPTPPYSAETPPTGDYISTEELNMHNTDMDCWVAIDGKVFDYTDYLYNQLHPAPENTLSAYCGKVGDDGYYGQAAHPNPFPAYAGVFKGLNNDSASLSLSAGVILLIMVATLFVIAGVVRWVPIIRKYFAADAEKKYEEISNFTLDHAEVKDLAGVDALYKKTEPLAHTQTQQEDGRKGEGGGQDETVVAHEKHSGSAKEVVADFRSESSKQGFDIDAWFASKFPVYTNHAQALNNPKRASFMYINQQQYQQQQQQQYQQQQQQQYQQQVSGSVAQQQQQHPFPPPPPLPSVPPMMGMGQMGSQNYYNHNGYSASDGQYGYSQFQQQQQQEQEQFGAPEPRLRGPSVLFQTMVAQGNAGYYSLQQQQQQQQQPLTPLRTPPLPNMLPNMLPSALADMSSVPRQIRAPPRSMRMFTSFQKHSQHVAATPLYDAQGYDNLPPLPSLPWERMDVTPLFDQTFSSPAPEVFGQNGPAQSSGMSMGRPSFRSADGGGSGGGGGGGTSNAMEDSEEDVRIREEQSQANRKMVSELLQNKQQRGLCGAIAFRMTSKRLPIKFLNQWTYGNAIFAVLFVALNFLALFLGNDTLPWANGWGSLAAANAVLLVLPATRNSVLTWLLGLSFDHTIVYHRMLGRWAVVCTSLHFILYFMDEQKAKLFKEALSSDDRKFQMVSGVVGLVAALLIYITSTDFVRRRHFNIFFWSHFLFFAFFVFAALHMPKVVPFVIAAAGFYGLDRLLRVVWGLKTDQCTHFELAGQGMTRLRFPKNWLAEKLDKYKVGQYVFVNFPAISRSEWHPFSLSSGPRENDIELHIRQLGDHTALVCQLAKKIGESNLEKPKIRVDGPYGGQDFNFRCYPVLLLAGGGVGITPVMGILKDVYNVGNYSKNQLRLVMPHVMQAVYVVWVMRTVDEYVYFKSALEACMHNAGFKQFPKLYVYAYVTREKDPTKVQQPLMGGRPDFRRIFSTIQSYHQDSPSLVFSCGPSAMVNEMWDESVSRTTGTSRFDFHHETFEF